MGVWHSLQVENRYFYPPRGPKTPKLLRGGPSEFHISRFLTLKLCHTPILHQIYPKKVLKWPWECFLQNHFSKFDPNFSVLGNPLDPEFFFFFSKIFFWNLNNLANFEFFSEKNGVFLEKKSKMSENWRNRNFCFQHFLQNRFPVILSPNWG